MDGANGDLAGGDYTSLISDGSGNFSIGTGNQERFRIEVGGNVGIGTTAPVSILNTSGSNQGITHRDASTGKGYIRFLNGSSQIALFGVAGSWEGSSLQDTMIAAETGYNIRFYTNGSATPKMYISSSGNVGINDTTPSEKLDVGGSIRAGGSATSNPQAGAILGNYSAGTSINSGELILSTDGKSGWDANVDEMGRIRFWGKDGSGIGVRDAAKIVAINETGNGSSTTTFSAGLAFYTSEYNATVLEAMRITNDRRVGIKTDTPRATLEVRHRGGDGDTGISIIRDDTSTIAGELLGSIGFDSADGNVPSSNLEASAYIAAYASEDHGIYDKGGHLAFGTAPTNQDDDTVSSEHMRITQAGRVGIGTTDPTAKLEVVSDEGLFIKSGTNGPTDGALLRFSDNEVGSYAQYGFIKYKHADGSVSQPVTSNDAFIIGGSETNTVVKIEGHSNTTGIVRISDAFDLPTSDGTSGQVLQTDGAGAVTWETVSGGGGTADDVKTVATNTNANFYLTFVNSNNTTATAETVYTSDGLYVNPSTDAIYATGNIISYASSDRRLKDNLTPIANATEKIGKLTGYEFDWNDKQSDFEGHDVGVVAQEVEEVLPEVVVERKDGYKAVNYEKIVALLIEGMKEQQAEIDALKEEIKNLKG
mgnify:CR=1 FL=1